MLGGWGWEDGRRISQPCAGEGGGVGHRGHQCCRFSHSSLGLLPQGLARRARQSPSPRQRPIAVVVVVVDDDWAAQSELCTRSLPAVPVPSQDLQVSLRRGGWGQLNLVSSLVNYCYLFLLHVLLLDSSLLLNLWRFKDLRQGRLIK